MHPTLAETWASRFMGESMSTPKLKPQVLRGNVTPYPGFLVLAFLSIAYITAVTSEGLAPGTTQDLVSNFGNETSGNGALLPCNPNG